MPRAQLFRAQPDITNGANKCVRKMQTMTCKQPLPPLFQSRHRRPAFHPGTHFLLPGFPRAGSWLLVSDWFHLTNKDASAIWSFWIIFVACKIINFSLSWNTHPFLPLEQDDVVSNVSGRQRCSILHLPQSCLFCNQSPHPEIFCQVSSPRLPPIQLKNNTFSTPTSSQCPSLSIKRGPPESPSHGSVILPAESKLLV